MKGCAANKFAWSSEAKRPQAEKTLDNFLKEAAEAGYDAIEFVGEGVAEGVKRYGLKVCGTYVGGPLHKAWSELDAEQKLLAPARELARRTSSRAGSSATKLLAPARELARLGGDYLAVNSDPKGSWGKRERKTEDDLKRQRENLSRLAKEVKPLGLRVILHNHANTNPLHLDDLKSVTEYADASVGVCLDTGWAITSGDDPVARARALGRRLSGLHLRNQRGEVPVEWLGEGDMDLAAFIRVLKENGYAGWLTTELWHRPDVKVTRSLMEDQRRSVELLRKLWA